MNRLSSIAVFCLAALTLPVTATATDLQLTRLASQLSLASFQIAKQLGDSGERGYSRVRFSARQLGQEASELVDAISHKRSLSYRRAAFNDVVRHYHQLQDSFLRAPDVEDSRLLIAKVQRISDLYIGLNAQYQSSYYRPAYPYQRQDVLDQPDRRDELQVPQSSDRLNSDRHAETRQPQFDHGSAVLERQARQERGQRRLDDILQRRHGDSARTVNRP